MTAVFTLLFIMHNSIILNSIIRLMKHTWMLTDVTSSDVNVKVIITLATKDGH